MRVIIKPAFEQIEHRRHISGCGVVRIQCYAAIRTEPRNIMPRPITIKPLKLYFIATAITFFRGFLSVILIIYSHSFPFVRGFDKRWGRQDSGLFNCYLYCVGVSPATYTVCTQLTGFGATGVISSLLTTAPYSIINGATA